MFYTEKKEQVHINTSLYINLLLVISGSFYLFSWIPVTIWVISLAQYSFAPAYFLWAFTGKCISICYRPNNTLYSYYFYIYVLFFKSVGKKKLHAFIMIFISYLPSLVFFPPTINAHLTDSNSLVTCFQPEELPLVFSKAGLLATNSLNVLFIWEWKDGFAGYRVLSWQLIFWSLYM